MKVSLFTHDAEADPQLLGGQWARGVLPSRQKIWPLLTDIIEALSRAKLRRQRIHPIRDISSLT